MSAAALAMNASPHNFVLCEQARGTTRSAPPTESDSREKAKRLAQRILVQDVRLEIQEKDAVQLEQRNVYKAHPDLEYRIREEVKCVERLDDAPVTDVNAFLAGLSQKA
ncbi:MAG: hypothetical protein K1X28_00755 [Parachlamydiales bacterium]|nr:hypothetical protein [Parachlamydiales bacterium]